MRIFSNNIFNHFNSLVISCLRLDRWLVPYFQKIGFAYIFCFVFNLGFSQEQLTSISSGVSSEVIYSDNHGDTTFIATLREAGVLELYLLTDQNQLTLVSSVDLAIDIIDRPRLYLDYPHAVLSIDNKLFTYNYISKVIGKKTFMPTENVYFFQNAADKNGMLIEVYDINSLNSEKYTLNFNSLSIDLVELDGNSFQKFSSKYVYKLSNGSSYAIYDINTKKITPIFSPRDETNKPVIINNYVYFVEGDMVYKRSNGPTQPLMKIDGISSSSRVATDTWNGLIEIEVTNQSKDHKVYYIDPNTDSLKETIVLSDTNVVSVIGVYKRLSELSYFFVDLSNQITFVKDKNLPSRTTKDLMLHRDFTYFLSENLVMYLTPTTFNVYDYEKEKITEICDKDELFYVQKHHNSAKATIIYHSLTTSGYKLIDHRDLSISDLHQLTNARDVGISDKSIYHELESYILLINDNELHRVEYDGGSKLIAENEFSFSRLNYTVDNGIVYYVIKKDNTTALYMYNGIEPTLISEFNSLLGVERIYTKGDFIFLQTKSGNYYLNKWGKELTSLNGQGSQILNIAAYKDLVIIQNVNQIVIMNRLGELSFFPYFYAFSLSNGVLYGFSNEIHTFDLESNSFVTTDIPISGRVLTSVSHPNGVLIYHEYLTRYYLSNLSIDTLTSIVENQPDPFEFEVFDEVVSISDDQENQISLKSLTGKLLASTIAENISSSDLDVLYNDTLLVIEDNKGISVLKFSNNFTSSEIIFSALKNNNLTDDPKIINYQSKYLTSGENLYKYDTVNDEFLEVPNIRFDSGNGFFIRNDFLYYFGHDTNTGKQMYRYSLVDGIVNTNETRYLKNISVYPNPVSDKIYIDLPDVESISYKVYDISGILMRSGDSDFLSNDKYIDVSVIREGVYFVILYDDQGQLIGKSKFIVCR